MVVLLLYLTAILQCGVIGIKEEPRCKCVKPTTEEAQYNPCPTGECLTLMDYAKYPENFSNDTTFKFLPGNHSLDGVRIHIHYVHNLTLSGLLENGTDSGLPIVQCSGPISGFWFEDTLNLEIDSLGFNNCGFYQYQNQSQAILMQHVTNLNLSHTHIYNTSGFGLYIVNLKGISQIHNTVIDKSHNESGCFGGNLRLQYNDGTSNSSHSVLVENSFFTSGHVSHTCNIPHYRHEGYASGLSVFLNTTDSIEMTLRNVTLAGNTARNGGNLAIVYVHVENITNWTSSVKMDNCKMLNGSAYLGGGMYLSMVARQDKASYSSYQFVDVININNTLFEGNTAEEAGGGFYAQLFEEVKLSTGANIKFSNSTFRHNSVQQFLTHGGGVALSILTFNLASYMPHRMPQYSVSLISCRFYENVVRNPSLNDPVGSGIIYIEQNSLTYFQNVEITSNNCTGIALVRSNIVFKGNNTLSGNHGNYGGGIVLCDNSILYLQGKVTLNISHNKALSYGGGIYAEFDCTQAIPPCFYQFDNQSNKNIIMDQNYAIKAGSELYGGSIEYCYYFGRYNPKNSTTIFFEIFQFPNHLPNDTSYITSSPQRACFCTENNGHLSENCSQNGTEKYIFPGSAFEVPLVIVGQRNGTVPGNVVATNVLKENATQPIPKSSCTKLTYFLSPENVCADTGGIDVSFTVQDSDMGGKHNKLQKITMYVKLNKCPLGFKLSCKSGCVCDTALQELGKIVCDIKNRTIYKHKHSQSWFGFLPGGDNVSNSEIVSYSYCPFDYCNKKVAHAIQITRPWTADDQCAFNRSGILCGRCNGSLSLMLGSSRCSDCSGKYSKLRVVGLVALFGVAGLLLVVFFGITDTTVAEGALNAVIFYVNVVAVNRSVLFTSSLDTVPENLLLKMLGIFISWMNLDFGIETCFYDGMNPFQKALLQFVFPLYLWCISGAVIFLCRKSFTMSNLFGKNSVKILATVILHSYAKLLRAVIGALFYTPLHHSSGHSSRMWSVDGNVYYLGESHVILFVIAIIVGLITLPYTLVLLFIQCLRRRSNMKVLFWVNKLKPFFDAYTGPYKDNYHFWTGFLLVVRIALFIIIAVDTHSGQLRNITLIIATTSVLFVTTRPGIYKNWALNVIEVFIYANLTVLAVGTAYTAGFNHSNNSIIVVCVGSVYLLFCGIVVYHILKKLSVTRRWGLMKVWLLDRRWPWMKKKQIRSLVLPYVDPDNDEDLSSSDSELDPILQNAPPVARYDQYREPLIGTAVN